MREYLEKKWAAGLTRDETIRLGVETLLEVVESAGNIEICVVNADKTVTNLDEDALKALCDTVNQEKAAAEEAKKNKTKKD